MAATAFTFSIDSNGMLSWQNEQTLERYHALRKEGYEIKLSDFDMFLAFNNQQFKEGLASIRPLTEGEKPIRAFVGVYGTKDGVNKYLAHIDSINKRIAEECDPQEVYCYEYNNHECYLAFDGDLDAMNLIVDLFGYERAKEVKRYSDYAEIEIFKPKDNK